MATIPGPAGFSIPLPVPKTITITGSTPYKPGVNINTSSVRPYVSNRSYTDTMRRLRSRTVWNAIFKLYPQFAEFRTKDQLPEVAAVTGALKSSIEDYIRQSERKKPYRGDPFLPMEDLWEGPPTVVDGKDWPWITIIPGIPPWLVIFKVWTEGCYKAGETVKIKVNASHPVIGIRETFPGLQESGTIIATGAGGNDFEMEISADGAEKGTIILSFNMNAFRSLRNRDGILKG